MPSSARLLATVAIAAVAAAVAWTAAPSIERSAASTPRSASVQIALAATTPPTAYSDVFTPITPCRILDTRVGSAIAAGRTLTFNVFDSGGIAAQGGKSSGCGIPDYATALAATVIAVGAKSDGRITAFDRSTPRPAATTLSALKGRTVSTGAVIAVKSLSKPLAIYSSATTDVAVDVTGYYSHTLYAAVRRTDAGTMEVSGTLTYDREVNGTLRFLSPRALTGCAATATAISSEYSAGTWTDGSVVAVFFETRSGTPRTDIPFSVVVTC